MGAALACTVPSVWYGMVLLAGSPHPWKCHFIWSCSLWWWGACVLFHWALWSLHSIKLWYYWLIGLLQLFHLCDLSWFIFVYMYSGCGTHWVIRWKIGYCLWYQFFLVCMSSLKCWGMRWKYVATWSLEIPTYPITCLCSPKYDGPCHVGYFKNGWKCFIVNMQGQNIWA